MTTSTTAAVPTRDAAAPLRVLIVVDREHEASAIVDALAGGGLAPTACRVQSAVGLEAELGGDWDVVISDYMLERLTGMEAFEIVRRQRADLPFIFVSEPFGLETVVEVVQAGVYDCLLKERLTQLPATVRHAMAEAAAHRELARSRRQIDYEIRFERLVSDVAGRIVNASETELLHEISNAQREVCTHLDLDMSTVWETADSQDYFTLTSIYPSDGAVVGPREMNSQELFPWTQRQILDGHIVAVESVENLPPEAGADQESWMRLGTRSSLVYPLQGAGGESLGVLTLAATREERRWPPEVVERLAVMARVFAGALARKKVEDALRASELRFRSISESALSGIYIIQDDRFVYVNPALAEIYGSTVDELIGSAPMRLIHPDDRQYVAELLRQGMAGETDALRYQTRGLRVNGEVRHIEVLRSRTELDGRVALIGNVVDVTDRVHAERALAERENLYRMLTELSPDSIVQTDADGRITVANVQAAVFRGVAHPDDLIGRHLWDFVPHEQRATMRSQFDSTKQAPLQFRAELVAQDSGERRILETHTTPLPAQADRGVTVMLVSRDVTERVRAEEVIRRSEEHYRTLIDLLPDSVVQIKENGNILIANQQAARLRNVPHPNDMIGTNIFDYVAESEHDFGNAFKASASESGVGLNPGSYLVLRDGTRRWVDSTIAHLPSSPGGDNQMILVTRDLTDRRRLEEEARRLQEENVRLGAEVDITRRIQQMVLPQPHELTELPGLDFSASMHPASEVGGDYYDILRSGRGGLKIGIGDVTGHGLESGVLMLMVQTAVRTLQEAGETDLTRFLDVLNRTIYGNLQRMGSDKNLTLSLLDYTPGRLRLSGQHESLLLLRSGQPVEVVDTIDLGFPVGIMDDIASFLSYRDLELGSGDVVVLYSDGIPEAENDLHEQFGMERFLATLELHRHGDVDAIRAAVLDNLHHFIGEQEVFDDITLVVMKHR